MISRVADCCFWFGRYLERAESTARLLQVTAGLALDGDLTPRQCWHPVVITAGEEAAFVARHGEAALSDGERVQAHLAIDPDVGVSIVSSVAAARENARSIREVISLEVWESINELYLWTRSDAARAAWEENRYEHYRRVRSEIQLCLGLLRGTMLHDEPMYFTWLGVLLERTGQTARILDVHHHAFTRAAASADDRDPHRAIAVAHWLSLLRACYGFEPFMKSHRGSVTGEAVAAFLVFEARFPRAVRYCVRRARESMIDARPPGTPPLRALAHLDRLEADLAAAEKVPLDPARLHAILTNVVDTTHAVSSAISDELFGAAVAAPAAAPTQSQSQA
jgi:uncharacterized alpha-E superfamily protein